jgi:hypothetical protein
MKTRLFLLLLLLPLALSSYSQDSDVELWVGPVIRVSFLKRFRAEIEQQVRFHENISAYDFTLTELGLRTKIIKGLYFKTSYRYSFMSADSSRPADEEYDEQRYKVDLSYGRTLFKSDLSFDFRTRFEDTRVNISGTKYTYWRNKLELSYNLSKLVDPFISAEVFYRFNQKNEIRKYRYTLGADWRISHSFDLSTYFHYQQQVHVKNPTRKIIAGLSLTFDIN